MSADPSNPSTGEGVKLLPGDTSLAQTTALPGPSSPPPVTPAPPRPAGGVVPYAPQRQLSDLPKDELEHLANEFGLDPTRYKTRPALVTAVHERRQLIASLDRDAMLDVIRWSRRPVTINAGKEQIAQEIARIGAMKFAGLSQRGLMVVAAIRGVNVENIDDVPTIIRKLKRQEGFFHKLNRKRRAFLGAIVSNIVGEANPGSDYQFLPPPAGENGASPPNPRAASIKDEIEESGLFGGITNRIKKTADQYLNQKLDEIEARIDRKLDEIDRKLSDWRDKEIANRIKILKITLWASVIVGVFSLIYSYVKVYLAPRNGF